MLNKTLLGLSLVAAFSTASLSVQADEYHVVVPAPGKAAPYASIKLELNPASLPVGVVGDTYAGFDFNSALRITGDPELDMSQVKWVKYTGDLPYGLTLSSSGSLSGMPAESDSSTFQALAKYKTKTALGTYTVQVNDIEMVLSDSLSLLEQGQSSTIDLDTLLFVTGDPAYQAGMASWDIRGALPAGLIFSDGTITGTPSGYGSYPITVQASYKKRLVEKTVNIEVERVELTIVNTAGVRTWEDGSVANSCQDYRNPTWPMLYQGATGDGVYRVKAGGQPADVYCDMTTDGGGWMLTFSGNSTFGHGLTLSSITQGYPLQTYSASPAAKPAYPSERINNFDQILFKGGSSVWQAKIGHWARFNVLVATADAVPTTLSGVLTSNGRTALWTHNTGWNISAISVYSYFGLWDVEGISPMCGGASTPGPKECPYFWPGPTNHPNHFDTDSYRELYVR